MNSPMPDRPVKRRRLLAYGLGGAGLAAMASGGFATYLFASAKIDTTGKVNFVNPLLIPELAQGRTDGDRRVFDLRMRSGKSQLKTGAATETWGFNGNHLGPTLRAKRGETVQVNVHNTLDETSSVHWHGMHLPAEMDGGPHQPIAAQGTWTPQWKIDQPAATLWYHPHPHGETARHIYRGLAGMFIVDDDEEAALELPRQYGIDDIPLIVQDRNFHGDNRLDEDIGMLSDSGILGADILVNGTYAPYCNISASRVRLRILNGSNARVYNFGFSDDRPFAVIASDGGLLSAPQSTRRIQMSPGERVELVADFARGETVTLRSYPPDLQTDFFESRPHGGDDSFDILQLRAAAQLTAAPALPQSLASVPRLNADDAVITRQFRLSGRTLNGKKMDMSRIDFAVQKDSTEIWELVNGDASVHNFHIHDVQFQILTIGGHPPPPHLAGWKDTVQLFPEEPTRIALHFKDYADPNMPYMCHCHFIYHEDNGLMAQFVVLDKGQQVGTPPGSHNNH